jgi:hypothetical protein
MKKTERKASKPEQSKRERTSASKKLPLGPDSDRKAVLDEHEKLQRLFPLCYSAEVGVWSGDNVEVMLKLTYSQAVNLARLLKENKL